MVLTWELKKIYDTQLDVNPKDGLTAAKKAVVDNAKENILKELISEFLNGDHYTEIFVTPADDIDDFVLQPHKQHVEVGDLSDEKGIHVKTLDDEKYEGKGVAIAIKSKKGTSKRHVVVNLKPVIDDNHENNYCQLKIEADNPRLFRNKLKVEYWQIGGNDHETLKCKSCDNIQKKTC